jgi:hypothetical protein
LPDVWEIGLTSLSQQKAHDVFRAIRQIEFYCYLIYIFILTSIIARTRNLISIFFSYLYPFTVKCTATYIIYINYVE